MRRAIITIELTADTLKDLLELISTIEDKNTKLCNLIIPGEQGHAEHPIDVSKATDAQESEVFVGPLRPPLSSDSGYG